MEATEEDNLELLHTILPPKLEDAGLEDCALPLHSIHEAFRRAAVAVAVAGGCVTDTPPSQTPPDAAAGVIPASGPCTAVKGGVSTGGDAVVVVGERNDESSEKKDDVVVIGGGRDEGGGSGGCVDGVRDLKIKDGDDGGADDDVDGGDKDEKPILVEGYFLNP